MPLSNFERQQQQHGFAVLNQKEGSDFAEVMLSMKKPGRAIVSGKAAVDEINLNTLK
jgi:hypothetical protein